MNSVDIVNFQVLGCPHLNMVRDPLFAAAPNVAVYGTYTFVLVVEQNKVKLMCWDCCKKGLQHPSSVDK